MTSKDFIRAEAENTDRIILYREGLFWKAYERSAFAVCMQVRPFKPTKRSLKTLGGGELISIGFLSSTEDRVLDGLTRLETEPDPPAYRRRGVRGVESLRATCASALEMCGGGSSCRFFPARVCGCPEGCRGSRHM